MKTKGESEYIWVRLDKEFFNINEDLYVCYLYASPDKSGREFGIEVYEKISNSIADYCSKGKCLILGDMNAHTSVNLDYINNDEKDNDLISLPESYEPDIPINRRNSDKSKVNEHGTALLDLCTDSGMRILNGRKLGDIFGKPTYFGPMCKAPTLIDYGLVPCAMCHVPCDDLKDIIMFKVQDLCHLSDHCLIHACVTASVNVQSNSTRQVTRETLVEMPRKFIWEESRRKVFLGNINSPSSRSKVKEILNLQYANKKSLDIDDIEDVTSALTEIITSAAEKSFKRVNSPSQNKKPKKQYASHFDLDCKKLLKQVKQMCKKLSREPQNCELRKVYYRNKKHLHHLVKQKLASEKESIAKELCSQDSTLQKFWKMLDKLQQCTHGKNSEKNYISADTWQKHFKTLMQTPSNNQNDNINEFSEYINNHSNWEVFNELCIKIKDDEITKAINSLKRGKACGLDLVTNEMIKTCGTLLLPALSKLFNMILVSGHYPSAWCSSWIKPLHKGGDRTEPNRYRGISIMSCMGKLFCTVLNNRLKFIEENELRDKHQIGFTKDCRTSDHMFALKTMIDKYSQDNQKLYTCFIDFSKAFDTVSRDALLYKLLKMGIGGSFTKILKNIYDKSLIQVNVQNHLTKPFHDNIGVKQGCVLSPNLFKLFTSDLCKSFNDECRPVELYQENISCLMLADDVVLTSETAEGLQLALDILEVYSKKWQLKINCEKTKIMIFNKPGKLLHDKFTLGNEQLENTNSYTYLSVTFVPSGKFKTAIEILCKKASKAMFKAGL